MSRYLNIETIIFTDKNGKSFPVKEIRDIPKEAIAFEIDINKSDFLDEIASRRDVYGDFGENETYRLFDANVIKLFEVDFDLTKLKSIKVPL